MKLVKLLVIAVLSISTIATSSPAFAASTTSKTAVKVAEATETPAKPAPAPAPKMVVVQPGEYLEKIAGDNQTTSLRLFYANTGVSNPDLIFPNQQLRVPTAEEALAPREVPVNQSIPTPTPVASTQAAAPAPAAPRASAPVSNYAPSDGSVWDRLAACEAGGNWAINTGNGYYGGLQFSLSSWRSVGGSGLPSSASREEQIMRGKMLQARSGWGAWPSCTAKLGLRQKYIMKYIYILQSDLPVAILGMSYSIYSIRYSIRDPSSSISCLGRVSWGVNCYTNDIEFS